MIVSAIFYGSTNVSLAEDINVSDLKAYVLAPPLKESAVPQLLLLLPPSKINYSDGNSFDLPNIFNGLIGS